MHKLVIDLEMNNTVHINNTPIHEIIEIGAVLLNEANDIIGEFKTYVKPEHSKVSKRITHITGIKQENVEDAPILIEALDKLKEFIGDREVTMYAWSDSDSIAILKELGIKEIKDTYIENLANNFVDIQNIFDTRLGLQKQTNLEKALELLGLSMDGQAHDALVDARNTTKLFIALEDDKEINKIANRIKEILSEKPVLTASLGSMFNLSAMIA